MAIATLASNGRFFILFFIVLCFVSFEI
jgi:hypothetical protein